MPTGSSTKACMTKVREMASVHGTTKMAISMQATGKRANSMVLAFIRSRKVRQRRATGLRAVDSTGTMRMAQSLTKIMLQVQHP